MRFEHSGRGMLAGTAVLASLFAVPGTALAGPRAKAHYDGRDATNHQALVVVNKRGTQVAFTFETRAACTDGKRRALVFIDTERRPARVLPDGSFTKSLRDRRGSATVQGTFDAVGNTVAGTYSIVARTRRYTCRTGDVAFALHRDGTAGAPHREGAVATGLYQASGPGVVVRMRTVLPARIIHAFRAVYDTKCSSGKHRAWSV